MERHEKIYVAGHTGLVGSAILRRLEADEFTNLTYQTHKELDLTNAAEVEAFFKQESPEYVFLAAAKVGGILANYRYPADFIYKNLMLQTHVIHQSFLHGVKRLLFLGSSCIYPRKCPQPMREEHLLSGYLEPTNQPYAVAKIAGIEMCQSYNRQHNTHYISVMPTNLYGPNDNFDLETSHVLPALIRKFHLSKLANGGEWETIRKDEARFGKIPEELMESLVAISTASGYSPPDTVKHHFTAGDRQAEITIWGTGNPRRELLHVDDLADACVFLMNAYEGKDLINIGTGKDMSIRELAEVTSKLVGFTGQMRFDPSKPDGTPQKLLDVSRLRQLGWESTISLREGIQNTYEWYSQELDRL